ncbi:MAG: cell division protein FtsA [Chloroflexi bacterium RBG_13_51_52]|nr:MAG: cell division protein FtsA [Chloroflexi bacterium RBG_13_51_52]
MKRDRVGAIDVGTTKVCTIMADVNDDGLRVLGVGVVPSHGLHKGLVVSINEARESIRESVRLAEQMAGRKLESAYVGVTGRHVSAVNKTGSVSITRNNQIVRPDDLKRVLDVARNVKVAAENKVLHVIPRGYVVDGQAGVRNPVGLQAYRLDVETHIITAAATSVQNLTKCIRSIGVEVEDLVMEPLASAEAVLEPDEKQGGVLLADIGGGTTDLALFKDSTIYHTSVLPVAGYQVTRDISIGLGINYELAEEMKKRYGDVTPREQDDAAAKEIAITGDGHSVSYRDLSEIIRVRVGELLRLIMLELPQSDYHKLIPSGVVITGGGANLPGIAELGQKIMRMPVRLGVPMMLPGVSDMLDNPAYATSVGLLMWKLKSEDTETSKTRRKGLHGLLVKMLRLFR